MKRTTIRAIFLMAILLVSFYPKGWGQLYVDDFSYTVGSALTANGWNITGSAASPVVSVTATSISYPGYLSSGIGDEVSLATSGQDVNHLFTSQTSGAVYASFLVNVTSSQATGDYFFLLGAATIGTTYHGRIYIKKDPSSTNYAFGITKTGAVGLAVFTPYSYVPGTTYLVVLKYNIVTGPTNDYAQIYINPTLNAAEPSTGWIVSTDNTSADLANLGTVGLRQGSASAAAALKIDGIRVATTWGEIVGVPASPNITASPSTLSGFTYVVGSGPSTPALTFSVSGTNLTDPITIDATTNFEISLASTSGYTTPLTLTPSSGTVGSTTIYVRLKAGLSEGTYSGEIINVTSTGATAQTVSCSGTVTALTPPVITVTPGTLTGFTYVAGAGPSTPAQSFTVSGSNLTDNISVAASTNYEISLSSGAGYTTPIVLTQTGGTVGSTIIYVRLKAGLAVGNYNTEAINSTSTGATLQTVTCSGSVTAAPAGAVNIVPSGNVTENFDVMGVSGTATLPSGWKADKLATAATVGTYSAAVTATNYTAGNNMSGSAANGIYNYAAGDPATATDRAIGGVSSGSASKSVNVYVQLHNNGTGTIPSLIFSYDVEKYRDGTNAEGFTEQMYYSTDGISWTSAGTDFRTSFTGGDAATAGYASAPGLVQSVTSKTLGVSMAAGSDLYLAWNYSVTTGTTTSSAQALGIDNVSITASTASVAALPTFAPPAGTYYTTQNVVLNCATSGATIYYTTDGSDPTELSTPYTLPIQLLTGSGTTTIKAKAYAVGYDPSAIATGVFVLPTVVEVANMAALRAGTPGLTVYRLTGEAVVSFFRNTIGPNAKQMYLQDNTGAMMVYDVALIINTYAIGDGVTGLTGRLQNYNGMIELIPLANPGTPTSTGNVLTPELKTIATLTSADQAKLVRVSNATFTGATGTFAASHVYPLTDPSGAGFFRTSFSEANYISTAIPTSPVDMIAIVSQYIDTIQLTSRFLADITVAPPTWTSGWPKAEDAVPTGFSAKVNINTPGTAYLVVLPSGATAPTSAQVKAGQDATGTAVGANFKGTIACIAGNTEYVLGMSGMASSTAYDVYFVAETGTSLQVAPVMKSVTTASGTTAPVVTSPTATSISATSAVLGGNLIAEGGSAISERGTVWSTTSPVTIDDNKQAEGLTALGIFSHLRSPLPTGVTIYYAAYATNGVGTTLSTQSSFITLVAEPTNHAQSFTAGTTTSTTIPLSWTDALASLGDVPATGYLIKGSAIGYGDIVDPVDGVPETDGLLVHNVNQGVQSDVMTGLNPGTTYFFKIYAYNSIGGTSINYKITPAAPEASATTAVILYENFDYTVGSFVGGDATAIPATTFSNNWFAHSGTGNIPVVAGTLSYTGLAAGSGGKITVPGNNNTTTGVTKDINRAITAPESVLYYSVLVNVVDSTQLSKTTTDYFMNLATTSGTTGVSTFGARLGILKVNTPATGYRLSIQNTSGGSPTYTQLPQDLNFGTTYLVVVKYDRSASPTVATLWVNPTPLGGIEPAGSVSNASGTSAFSGFGSICVRNGSGTPKAEYDEIRVGTSFAQVTPIGATDKTLSLTYIFPEGLYAGSSTLNPSYDDMGLHFQADTADMITVELHNNALYATVEYSTTAAVSTAGAATVSIPGDMSSTYYLTIKHRNSIETTSADPVDFAGTTITYAYDAQAKAYGSNMGLMIDATAVFFAGDENQDGIVDGTDLSDIGNLADYATAGYLPQDINGDGLIDGSDLSITGNNADMAVGLMTP